LVGDSQLILGQLRRHKTPCNKRLLEFYAETRRLGDQLGVRQWIHVTGELWDSNAKSKLIIIFLSGSTCGLGNENKFANSLS
jgi:hypothetical protein